MKLRSESLVLCMLAFLFITMPLSAQNPVQREIAITIDDLPAGGANFMT
jgi:hypothetical protein